MKTLALLIGLISLVVQVEPVNYIGKTKSEIISLMQKNNPGFDLDEGAVNTTYKYIKFVDKYNEETYLFFLNEKDECTFTKLMSDYSNMKLRTAELDKMYKKAGDTKWIYVEKGTVYIIELIKEEWYFTILMKKKK